VDHGIAGICARCAQAEHRLARRDENSVALPAREIFYRRIRLSRIRFESERDPGKGRLQGQGAISVRRRLLLAS